MAEEIKDADDQMLETLFRSETIADDGFSDRIVGKIRRRLWLRRLSLPIAAAIGASIAIKPMVGVLASLYSVLGKTAVPDLLAGSAAQLPPVHLIVMGGMLLALVVVSIRMLEE